MREIENESQQSRPAWSMSIQGSETYNQISTSEEEQLRHCIAELEAESTSGKTIQAVQQSNTPPANDNNKVITCFKCW